MVLFNKAWFGSAQKNSIYSKDQLHRRYGSVKIASRYYLNGVDAFRLKLLLPLTQQQEDEIAARELERLSLSDGGKAAAAEPPNPIGAHAEQHRVQAPDQCSHHAQEGQSQQGAQSQKDAESSLLQKFDALRT